ncbi:MAG: prephenate dehydratase [archaeon]
MKISILGPRGTFSHEAALVYDKSARLLFENTIYDVFDALDKGKADAALVPIENSTSGTVGETLDALVDFDLVISRVIYLKVEHNLIGVKLDGIRKLYVHPQAHAQCRNYIRKNFSDAEIIHTSSNAASAKLAGNDDEGAIAPTIAAEIYGKNIIEKKVQDNGQNVTIFAVLKEAYGRSTGNDRTFVVFNCVDRPGILHEILGVFAKRNVNLSKIESRPNKKKMGEYIFYVEFGGHPDDENVKEILLELAKKVVFQKVLGAYPAGGVK